MGEGVVHGHIHNGDRYTFVHGHVHKEDGVCEGFDSDCDDIQSRLMFDFDSGRRVSTIHSSLSPSSRGSIEFGRVENNKNIDQRLDLSPSITPVQCCNPNILEICCDLDHPQNDSIQEGLQFCTSTSTATPMSNNTNTNTHQHQHHENNNNNNNTSQLNNYMSQDEKDMLIFADRNGLLQDSHFGSSTTSSSSEPLTQNEVTSNADEDLKILQDLCNISQLYEIPLAKHINHHHHNHEHVLNLLETQLPSNSTNTLATNEAHDHICNSANHDECNRQHHHHRIQVHSHDMKDYVARQQRKRRKLMESPMLNNKTLLSPQPITSNDREVGGSRAASNGVNNTINFNWNFKDDADIHCQWDDCDETYTTLFDLQKHMLKDHISNEEKQNIFNGVGHDVSLCQWKDCDFQGDDICSLVNHINDQHGIHFEINILKDQSNNSSPHHGGQQSVNGPYTSNLTEKIIGDYQSENSIDNDNNENKNNKNNRIENLYIESDEAPPIKKEKDSVGDDSKHTYLCKWAGCNQAFSSPGSLNDHLETVHLGKGKSQYTCGWEGCNKNFTQRQKLVRHLKVHSRYKPYKCTVCKKCFSTEDTLNQHLRIHSGEKPYECHICHKRFTIANSLKIHIRTHTGEKPLTCKICGRSFNESSNLSKHMKTHMKKYFCTECSRSFDTLNKFESHKKRCHSTA